MKPQKTNNEIVAIILIAFLGLAMQLAAITMIGFWYSWNAAIIGFLLFAGIRLAKK